MFKNHLFPNKNMRISLFVQYVFYSSIMQSELLENKAETNVQLKPNGKSLTQMTTVLISILINVASHFFLSR